MMNFIYSINYLVSFALFSIWPAHLPKKKPIQYEDNSYIINGTIRGVQSDWIYIVLLDSAHRIDKMDSVMITNQKFKFTGIINQPERWYLTRRFVKPDGKRGGFALEGDFILDKGTLTISCHKDSMRYLKASGTAGQNEFKAFKDKAMPISYMSDQLYGKLYTAERKKVKDNAQIDLLKKQMLNNRIKIKNLLINHVKIYPNSIVSAIIAKEHVYVLDVEGLNTVYALFSNEVKNTSYSAFIHRKMVAENKTNIGQAPPPFKLPDQNGKTYSLTDFKGKYTLVDFWASWCNPCRAEHPNLIKAYAQYKDKGFEILGVSMDGDRDSWLKAIKDDQLPWIQVSDLKGTKSELKILYGITSIPFNFLTDKEGKIIARNLRSNEVQQTLEKYLK